MKTEHVPFAHRRVRAFPPSWALLPGLVLILAACGESTAPEVPPVYDLQASLNRMVVFHDCENADGNPGDWNWLAILQVGPHREGAGVAAGTPGYPDSGSTLSWADFSTYQLADTLVLRGITEAQRDSITITVAGTEWDFDTDPPSPDPDMNDARETTRFNRRLIHQGAGLVTGPRCAIRLDYSFDWNEQ